MSAFIFNDRADVTAVYQAELPPNIKSEDALLDALAEALRFPDYFGKTWSALDECIRDLSWLPPGDIVLIHKDLPLTDNRASLLIYMCVLRDAVENWDACGSNLIYACPESRETTGECELLAKRNLFVVFPPRTQSIVERLLTDAHDVGGHS